MINFILFYYAIRGTALMALDSFEALSSPGFDFATLPFDIIANQMNCSTLRWVASLKINMITANFVILLLYFLIAGHWMFYLCVWALSHLIVVWTEQSMAHMVWAVLSENSFSQGSWMLNQMSEPWDVCPGSHWQLRRIATADQPILWYMI